MIGFEGLKKFWCLISTIQDHLELDDERFSKLFGIETVDFLTCRQNNLSLELKHVEQLAECLGLSLFHFLNRPIDITVLRNQFRGEASVLPETYSSNAFGNMASMRGMMQYLSLTHSSMPKLILADLQLDSRLLSQSRLPVNIQMYEDASQKISRLGLGLNDFRAMGKFVGRENLKNLDFKVLSKNYATLRPLERILRTSIDISDANHIYKIEKISDDRAVFSGRPGEKIQDAMGRKLVGNIFTSIIKEAVIAEIPKFLSEEKHYTTTLIQSVHTGGDLCLYEIKAS